MEFVLKTWLTGICVKDFVMEAQVDACALGQDFPWVFQKKVPLLGELDVSSAVILMIVL